AMVPAIGMTGALTAAESGPTDQQIERAAATGLKGKRRSAFVVIFALAVTATPAFALFNEQPRTAGASQAVAAGSPDSLSSAVIGATVSGDSLALADLKDAPFNVEISKSDGIQDVHDRQAEIAQVMAEWVAKVMAETDRLNADAMAPITAVTEEMCKNI